MLRIAILIFNLLVFVSASGQNIHFKFLDSTFLPKKPNGFLHGISGIEYDAKEKLWHMANDRGGYFIFQNIQDIRDFQNSKNLLVEKYTRYWFESIRIDPSSGRFFFAVENEFEPVWENPDTTTYVAWYDSYLPKIYAPNYLVAPIPLPVDNKGIESVAVTENGNVWVTSEVGWLPEDKITSDTVQFFRFLKDQNYQKQVFSYQIDRSGCPHSPTAERLGGISEILSVNENELLILERCWDNGPGGSKKTMSKLWQAKITGDQLIKSEKPSFDFNKQLPFDPDNLEGMTWWPTTSGAKKLILVSDDNPGSDNKQRTQLILLEAL